MKIIINDKEFEATQGQTILDAVRALGFDVPTMCEREGLKHFTSCMICQVKETGSGRLTPACSTPIMDGMQIDTTDAEAIEARTAAVELLLSEHIGDCEGPCTIFCPAHMDIPLMIRQIEAGDDAAALRTVKADIALPAVLGRICPAPCENGCRRKGEDAPVGICKLKQYVADVDLELPEPWLPKKKPASGKKVAIVGGGAAGLACAWHVLQDGHAVTIFDRNDKLGGVLQYECPDDRLDKAVLDNEIAVIRKLGFDFRPNTNIGADITLDQLRQDFDAIVLVIGGVDKDEIASYGLETGPTGFKTNRKTHQTSDPMIFAWTSKAKSKMAIRAVGSGKDIAASVDQFVRGETVTGPKEEFNSTIGKLHEGEIGVFMRSADSRERIDAEPDYATEEARNETVRCLHCDCRKQDNCKLRDFATEFGASQKAYSNDSRKPFTQFKPQENVILEPGKCIKCGICVRICQDAGVKEGFTFINRGYEVRISTPFNKPIPEEHAEVVAKCVNACPTGALAFTDD